MNPHILHALATERVADLHREAAANRPAKDPGEPPSVPSPPTPSTQQKALAPSRGER